MKSNPLNEFVLEGKISKGNKRQQAYINISCVLGGILFFMWMTVFFQKTFIDIKIILTLLLAPSLIAMAFGYKKYLAICGYASFIKDYIFYNILIRLLVFLLFVVPVGNIVVTAFFAINHFWASEKVAIIQIKPKNIYTAHGRRGKDYTSFEVTLDGVTKGMRCYDKSVDEISKLQLAMPLRKGYFGYYIYEKYHFQKAP